MQFENSLLQSHGCSAAERHLGEAHGTENAVLNDLCRGASDSSRICSRASRQDQSQLERERDALLENNIDEFLAAPRPLLTPKDIRLSTVWAVAAKHSLRSVALENLDYDITTPGPLPTLRAFQDHCSLSFAYATLHYASLTWYGLA